MWLKESNIPVELKEEYIKVIKTAKKKKDSLLYLHIQLFFVRVIIVMSLMFKTGSIDTFSYVKENYADFFENDTYKESAFSYISFINNMKNEMDNRFEKLITVFNSKGSAGATPVNVSTKKYVPAIKGVMPAEGYISSPYGIRQNPFNKKEKEFHTGMDIAAGKGTFIRAAFSGEVTDAASSAVAGNYIRISSENNISTLYAHNQFLFVKPGDKVFAGQVIATIGDTGLATGPHLHFEFIAEGIRYNPAYVLNM